jgi:hypothetical protein
VSFICGVVSYVSVGAGDVVDIILGVYIEEAVVALDFDKLAGVVGDVPDDISVILERFAEVLLDEASGVGDIFGKVLWDVYIAEENVIVIVEVFKGEVVMVLGGVVIL